MTILFKTLLLFLVTSILASCSITQPINVQQRKVQVTLTYPVKLPDKAGKPQLARTTVGSGFCIIELVKYPQCLAHEMRHCFEGNWHEGRETTANC